MAASDAMKGDVFSLLAEIDPPKGVDLSTFLDTALAIKGRIEGIVVTDGEDAIMRMSPPAACHALLEKNMSPIMVVNGRDRNRLSLQGDLLSAHALGVRTIILKQGHDPSIGDQPMVKSSGDLDLDVMLKIISALNSGKDLGGENLDGKTEFKFGAAIDLSDDVKVNRDRADELSKIMEYGADFVILSPTYDMNIIELFLPQAEKTEIKLYASIMLLKSVAMVRYLNNLPGVPAVPHEYLKRLMKSPIKSQAAMEIAAEFIKDIKQNCQGAVLPSLGWGKQLPEFLEILGR